MQVDDEDDIDIGGSEEEVSIETKLEIDNGKQKQQTKYEIESDLIDFLNTNAHTLLVSRQLQIPKVDRTKINILYI